MAFKRSFGGSSRFGNRNVRRRLNFNASSMRRKRRGRFNFRRNSTVSGVTGSHNPIQYRSRKAGTKRWRSILWRDTLAKQHWRSLNAVGNTQTTGATQNVGTVGFRGPEFGSTNANPFWITTGGAQDADIAETVPDFKGDIVLRGGKIGISLTIPSTVTDVIDCEIYLMFTIAEPDFGVLATPQPMGWDPSGEAEIISKFGSIIARRHIVLSDDNQTFQWEHRVRPRKIDKAVHVDVGGKQFWYLIKTANLTSATDVTVQVVKWHNFSFSGDGTS